VLVACEVISKVRLPVAAAPQTADQRRLPAVRVLDMTGPEEQL